jgi:hypothetical protein
MLTFGHRPEGHRSRTNTPVCSKLVIPEHAPFTASTFCASEARHEFNEVQTLEVVVV